MQGGGQADNGEKEEGDQKVWTIASLWPVKITPWRLQGQWGQSREGSQVFQSSEGKGSCLTKSLHPHWPNLYALSSLPLSVFFMFVKASHYVESDLADLGRHAYLYIQFPLCKWKLLSLFFFLSHCHCAQHCSWRGFYTTCCRSLKIQTPSCRLVNHTVVRGKYALFCWGLAIHHKAMTNKSNKLFIVSGVRMVTTLHTDWNGIYTKNWP